MNREEFKQAVRTAFDQASEGYDRPALRFFDRSAARLVELLDLKGNERLLDAACGTGNVALRAAERLPSGSVLGIDLSEGMLACARRKAAASNRTNVEFRCADVDDAELPAGAFDVLTCGFGVHFWSDMSRSLSHLLRALKPGGRLAITSFAKGSFEPQSDLALKRFVRYGVQLPTTYTWERLDSAEKNKWLLEKSGLRGIRTVLEPMGHDLKDAQEWWSLVRFTGFRAFLDKLSADDAGRYRAEHEQEIARLAAGGPLPLRVDVFFTTAEKPGGDTIGP